MERKSRACVHALLLEMVQSFRQKLNLTFSLAASPKHPAESQAKENESETVQHHPGVCGGFVSEAVAFRFGIEGGVNHQGADSKTNPKDDLFVFSKHVFPVLNCSTTNHTPP